MGERDEARDVFFQWFAWFTSSAVVKDAIRAEAILSDPEVVARCDGVTPAARPFVLYPPPSQWPSLSMVHRLLRARGGDDVAAALCTMMIQSKRLLAPPGTTLRFRGRIRDVD